MQGVQASYSRPTHRCSQLRALPCRHLPLVLDRPPPNNRECLRISLLLARSATPPREIGHQDAWLPQAPRLRERFSRAISSGLRCRFHNRCMLRHLPHGPVRNVRGQAARASRSSERARRRSCGAISIPLCPIVYGRQNRRGTPYYCTVSRM